ncbi:MAG: MarR family transcriptional regulator [Bulleidia sp.]|nr:MarR family transcriptional regulator [Bulleidia sp.]
MQDQDRLSMAKVRYLAALYDLDPQGRGLRSVQVAERLNVSRASVHTMLKKLRDMGYINMEHYGIVYLTASGHRAAEQCSAYLRRTQSKMSAEGTCRETSSVF